MSLCRNLSHESELEVKPLLDKKIQKNKSRNNLKPTKCRKVAVMICCLWFQMISVGVGFGLAVMYVEMIRIFSAARSDAALIQSIYLGIMTGGGILWTGLIRRFGPGPCAIVGTLASCVGIIASSFATNLPMVIVLTGVIGGLGMGILYITAFIVTSWTFHENPGVPLVIATIGSSIGQFVIPYLYEIFITEYGWPGAFQLIGALILNSLPFCVVLYTSKRFYVTGTDITSITKICDITLLKDAMVLFVLSCCLNLASTGPIESWYFADIMVLRGYGRDTGSLFVSLTGVGNFIGRVIGAFLRFYVKLPTLYHWIYLCPIIAASHVLVINIYDYWPLFGVCFLYGIPFGVTVAQVPAIMFEAAGLSRYPRAIALMNLMYGVGNFCGNLIGGFIKDETGSYDLMFYIGAASSFYITAATIVVTIIRKCCVLSSTYIEPRVEYSQIDNEDINENVEVTNVKANLLNGSDKKGNSYGSVKYSSEVDNIIFDSSDDRDAAANIFDFDTTSNVVTYNRRSKNLFCKTL